VNELFEIIYEDADLLVVNKPAGLVCHPTKTDERSSLIGRVRLHLGSAEGRLVNRLDRETSGLVLIAKSGAVAGELGKLIESSAVRKEYLAIVHGAVGTGEFTIDAPLGRDESSPVAIKDCVRPDGAPAQTQINTLETFSTKRGHFSLLRVQPRTGRKHQIRIHLAHIDHAIVGDKIYGADAAIYLRFVEGAMNEDDQQRMILSNHALHAGGLAFTWRGRDRHFQAQPGAEFQDFLHELARGALPDEIRKR
jgi:23S rRNA pseudouridine1911/1915/1917 synthase